MIAMMTKSSASKGQQCLKLERMPSLAPTRPASAIKLFHFPAVYAIENVVFCFCQQLRTARYTSRAAANIGDIPFALEKR